MITFLIITFDFNSIKKINRIWIYPLFVGVFLILVSSCNKDNETPATVTDIDGNVYHTVTIGTQVWMVENLKTTKYSNGDLIGTTTPATLDIMSESTPKYQWAYNDEESKVATYGRLYTWYAVADSRNVCPTGWHVPSDAEWTTLTTYLGGLSVAGAKLKEKGTAHWESPNTGATNESGYTALPGGFRYAEGLFSYIEKQCVLQSSSETDADNACSLMLQYDDANFGQSCYSQKKQGYSVRCVRD